MAEPAVKGKYPAEEWQRIDQLIKKYPALNLRTVRNWCLDGKCHFAVKCGKYWMVHPEQFSQWVADGGPSSS